MMWSPRLGTVMDIVVWLRSLGLGKYEAIFRENDIDEAVLPSLTHENLKELDQRFEDARGPPDSRGRRNGPRGCRGPHRLRRFSGASNRRRDAQSCSTLAGCCGAEQRGHCGEHPQARRESV